MTIDLPRGKASSVVFLSLSVLACTARLHGQETEFEPAHERLRDAVYGCAQPIEEIRDRYAAALKAAVAEDAGARRRFDRLARVEYLMGRAEQAGGDRNAAAEHYEVSLRWVDASLRLCETSEGYRMGAEALSQMCLTRGRAFILGNGLRVLRRARRAIELDPNNGKAWIILGAARIYPPAIFGGDPQEGLRMMERAIGMPDIEKDDLFNIYSAMGLAYSRLDRPEEALSWLEKALRLYPGNRFAGREYERVRQTLGRRGRE